MTDAQDDEAAGILNENPRRRTLAIYHGGTDVNDDGRSRR